MVVSVAAVSSADGGRRLNGLAYAALRPGLWGIAPRELNPTVRHVLVTTGSGQFAAVGRALAESIADALPEAAIALVPGPHSTVDRPEKATTIDAAGSLLEPLLTADLVISAAGQTMLEAAATGTPCVALPLVDNQRGQSTRLAEAGGVLLVDPPNVGDAVDAVLELSRDLE